MAIPSYYSCNEVNMRVASKALIFISATLVLLSSIGYSVCHDSKNHIKSATFVSESFEMGPGLVAGKMLLDIEIPKGHIGVKSFDAELVDEEGNSVPLYETYLHHWFAIKYFYKKNMTHDPKDRYKGIVFQRNQGTCKILPHYWGLGVESRGTPSKLPDPFVAELGNPTSTPPGYEEKWLFNIMAIDTRGAKDKEGCTECRCDHFDLPKDFYKLATGGDGKPLTPAYKGGIFCCLEGFHCKSEEGFHAPTRKLSLRYNITWVNWDELQIPVKFYIMDSTTRARENSSETVHDCQAEYTIPATNDGSKYHVQRAKIPMQKGGYLIYGTAHAHTGVVNATLYGQDGRILCTSTPKYGTGKEPGNEKHYAVGMSVCYPKPGSIKIHDGETLTMESRYKSGFRTGVMGHMYIHLAEKLP